MKQKLYLFICLLGISMISFGQTLDQDNATSISAGQQITNPYYLFLAQSFTNGMTGNLSRIAVEAQYNPVSLTLAGDFELTIYQGEGIGGTILLTHTFSVANNFFGELIIDFTPVSVTAGQITTFKISPTSSSSGKINLAFTNNNYSGGILYNGSFGATTVYDLWFKTFITLPTPATHLNLDGVDDYVELPNESNYDFTTNMTVEFMIKTSNLVGLEGMVTKGNGSWRIQTGSPGRVSFAGNNAFIDFQSTSQVNDNNWHHVAVTYDGAFARIYIDGVLENSVAASGTLANTPHPVVIGAMVEGTASGRFNRSSFDEVRIWNVARTAAQIANSKNCELQGNETGLLSYYKFNQGNDAADNAAITSLTDATSNGNNGTLTNLTLNGTSSNFLAGSPITTGIIVPSNATTTTPVTYTQGDTPSALTATTGTNGSGLLWYTTAIGGTGSTTAPTPSTAAVGSTSYWVSSTNTNGCESERTEIVVTINTPVPATHLNFDGVNDRVEIPNESNFDFTNTFSIEAWIRVSSFTQEWQSVITKGAEGPRIHRFGFTDFIAFGTGPGDDLPSTISVNDGNWHHIAAVCNNGVKTLYVDGALQGTQTVSTPLVTNNDNVRIGSQMDSYSPVRAFYGDIDEVRIWNIAKTATEINASKNCELQGSETGLIAYYKFNQGNDAADNIAITLLTDATSNGNDGTLTNFTLTGTTSNFLAGSQVTTGSIIPSVATVTTPVTYSQGATASALTATVGANGTSLVWYTTATGGTGSATAPTPSTATVGSTSYWVSSTNVNGCESARTEIVVTINAPVPATHLNFDGTNDFVNVGNLILTGSSYTKQAIIRPFNISSPTVNNILSSSSEVFWIYDGNIRAGNNGNFQHVLADASSLVNNWNMVTVTYDAPTATMKLYINETLVNENNSVPATVGGNMQIGAYGSAGVFNGDIDEVRIWNRSLTLAEIQNNMNCELPSPSTQNGLIAYYQFNQGIDAANNAVITTLADASGNANNGSLSGFALTGATSNWLSGSPIVTGTTCTTLNTSNFNIAENITLYPNPTNNFVTVAVNNVTNVSVSVYDLNGRQILNKEVSDNANTIDISNLQTGMYLFRIKSSEGETVKKVIKN